jgi:phage/plasmid-like protein (TIGR03299 family)
MALDVATKPRVAPWRVLTNQFPEGMRFKEAIEQVGLDYEVAFQKVLLADGREVPDKRATMRTDTDPHQYLAVVGGRYNIIQNREAFGFLENIVDSGDLKPMGAGWFKGGARPWIQARLPEDITIAGDQHIPFIFCANSHDGGLPVTIALSAVRVVCENTYAMNCGAPRRFVIRHLASAEARVGEARRVLEISGAYFKEFTESMNRLADVPISTDSFREVVHRLFPMPPKATDDQREAVARKRVQMLGVYNESPLVPRGTKYGAMQAITEWADHWKNGFKGEPRQRAERKTEWILLGDGVEFKDKAMALVQAAGR